ncbi:tRNA modification GTPase MnmE [endosymbiont of Sipalinus gigas]|uniref:tRNA uridine-5-carboxymethylaminomethyl(34) synthesis GTPase MnmE n=1 Tax=endosymbiont of Sipalinus gigas TaxID=1972134 RepID=UPI000DC709D3|nr:tRNA uridine-5-carboxymethylaminomethyl(34) synthesis GTPase MnmE [endosymbiont of Sipalinus gigas]BBA85383.1 tRNA modification GTPase MnmE [endosymbiont of Sipalinus gigas]
MNFYEKDTIIAISTPIGKSGIGIIKISGNNVNEISKIFFKKKKLKDRLAEFSKFINPFNNKYEIIDEGILIFFKSPNSYTGEDILEFQCHGNPIILNYILDCIIKNKYARLAYNGEFSKRAYLNNKIDLIQAESILNIIESESIDLVKLSFKSLKGNFSKKVNNIINLLNNIKIDIESLIDFSYENIDVSYKNINNLFIYVKKKIKILINESKKNLFLSNKLNISIIGNPNVGKSTLFNKLINKNKAIVTSIPGTTRDILCDKFSLNNIDINIFDSAGIHNTDNIVEKIGIKYTKKNLNKSNYLLIVINTKIDISEINSNNILNILKDNLNKYIFSIIKKNKIEFLIIKNKSDINNEKPGLYKFNNINIINISAKKNIGINIIKKFLINKFNFNISNTTFLSSKRYINLMENSLEILNEFKDIYECNDIVLFLNNISLSIKKIIEITGKELSNDEILNKIFSKFCIGK